MKKSRFTETQIVAILKEADPGVLHMLNVPVFLCSIISTCSDRYTLAHEPAAHFMDEAQGLAAHVSFVERFVRQDSTALVAVH